MAVSLRTKVTPALQENARYRYEETDEPMASIAADLGVTKRTFYVLVRRWGWRLRRDRPPRDLPEDLRLLLQAEEAVHAEAAAAAAARAAEAAAVEGSAAPAGTASPAAPSLADRLESEAEKQLARLQTMRAQLGPLPQALADAERIARTLERLTSTLFNVRRLRSPDSQIAGPFHDPDLPDDADAFREALARRIELFVRSRRAAEAIPGAGEPASAGEPG